jgi:hypothetical protein
MTCPHCHKKITPNEVFCHHCGHQLREVVEYHENDDKGISQSHLLGILGLCFILLPFVTFVLSGFGLKKAKAEHNDKAQDINSWAIALAFVVCALYAIILLAIFH